MPNGKISAEEILFVCQYVQEGKKAGEGKEDLQKRRDWLAEKLDRTPPTIRAISAHLKIRAQNLLKERNVDQLIPDAQAAVEGKGGEERRAIQALFAQTHGVDLELVNAMTDGVLPESSSDVGSSGEHADYDNEIKRKWRAEWKNFIDECTDPEKRSTKRILCLPGKQCLEIPLYLELGFDPKNIVGVEGGDKVARAEFELNAKKYGIDYRLCDLEEIVALEEGPFDIVSLDFHGYMSRKNFEICQRIPLADKALVMTNSLGRRENTQVQDLYVHQMRQFLDRRNEKKWKEDFERRKNFAIKNLASGRIDSLLPSDFIPRKERSSPELNRNDLNLNEVRDRLCPGLYNIGFLNHRKLIFQDRVKKFVDTFVEKKGVEVENVESIIVAVMYKLMNKVPFMLEELIDALKQTSKLDAPKTIDDLEFINAISHLIVDVLQGVPYFSRLKKMSYVSDTRSSPVYYTDMAMVENPIDIYSQVQPTAKFFFECIEKIVYLELEDESHWPDSRMGVSIFNRKYTGRKKTQLPREDLVVMMAKGEIIHHYPLDRFFRDVRRYQKAIKDRYPRDAWDMMWDEQRKEIN